MSAEQSAQRIYQLLVEALGADTPTRQRAEALLREAEDQQDFFASLADISVASDEQAASEVRFLAAVLGKNAVSRSWRRRVNKNAVTEDEREHVRKALLTGLGERNSTVATQLSVWISRVARADFPRFWPDLMTRLGEALRCNDRLIFMHTLVTLDMILKGLASRRLLADRQPLYRAAPALFSLLFEIFSNYLAVMLREGASSEDVQQSFDVITYCLKSFRRILSYGCETLSGLPLAAPLLTKIVEFPEVFMRGANGGTDFQKRLSLLAAKLVRSIQERHPLEFQPFLPTFLKLYFDTVISFNAKVSSDDTCFQAAKFLKNVSQCPLYGINSTTFLEFKQYSQAEPSPPTDISAETCRFIVLSFFNDARTNALIEAMITRIFVLNETELETWSNDPETLVREEDAAEWGTENLRNQCEGLFKLLLIRDKRRIVPLVTQLAESVSREKPLLLDACYRAVGRAVYDIHGAFNFEDWLGGHLGTILRADCSQDMGERIIQARTAWLVAQFAEQLTRESRQIVNPLLVRLMGFIEQDRVIALTAAKAIQSLVEDLGFHAGDFAPHLESCLRCCLRLVQSSETFETKRDLLGTVLCLVQRCTSQQAFGVMDLIATSLPTLWEETGKVLAPGRSTRGASDHSKDNGTPYELSSGGETLLRTAIVGLLSSIVKKVGAEALKSQAVHQIVFPVLGYAIDPSAGRGGVYMMEEGCDLWKSLVMASTDYTKELRMLFPQVEIILGVDFDNLRDVFKLMELYIVLGREEFMLEFGQILNTTLLRAIGAVKDRGHLALVEVMEAVLQLFPQDGVRFTCSILCAMLTKVLEKEESPIVVAAFVGLLARASISNIGDMETMVFKGREEVFANLLDALIENVDRMYRLPRKRLTVLALCGLTTRYCSNRMIQTKIPLVLNAVAQVLSEEDASRRNQNGRNHQLEFEAFIAKYGEDGTNENGSGDEASGLIPDERRRKLLTENDPVAKMDLRDACTHLLTSLKGTDQSAYEQILQATGREVLHQLETVLKK